MAGKKGKKERLDLILTGRGLAPSRERAKALIMEGVVFVNGVREDKAGTTFPIDCDIEVRGGMEFVSRGGYKLKKALSVFTIELGDKICMDIGASTGGFTDCMLQNGAKRVYSVDVGTNQLDYRLRTDERVVCMEQTNVRYMTPEDIADVPDFISVDVSFISLSLILPVVSAMLSPQGSAVCLIKPQFEAGREQVGKHGVVREPSVHRQVIEKVVGYAGDNGLFAAGLSFSPIKGPKGNIEYLLYLLKHPSTGDGSDGVAASTDTGTGAVDAGLIAAVVDDAHFNL